MDATFWALIALVLFLAILIWKKVPGLLGSKLDERAAAIAGELDEAKRLREEAQELLTEYEKKRAEAEAEADMIVAQAKREAEIYGKESRRKMSEQIDRRTRLAEQKIAQAEVAAIKDVRAAATDLAIEATARILATDAKGATGANLIDQSIASVRKQLN
ncbi:MAG: F0F1 ATP synthase subunit B [Anderseniella sp.]